ncbi:MAG TPA: hypothetical protein PKY59_09550 [Pyrinomonadaceae bacterium]|nr:hypothetical protein [Pyrinomonadaceae bacterium]
MQFKEKTDEIILREIPFGSWAIGLFVLFIFGIIAIAIAADVIDQPRSYFGSLNMVWFDLLARILMSLLLFAFTALMLSVGFYMLFSPIITAKINRNFKSIEIIKRRFFFKRTEKYFFTQVKEFRKFDLNNGEIYKFVLALVLTNNDEIDITTKGETDSKIDKIAEKLNIFIKSAK